MTGMAKLKANSDRPRAPASSNRRSRRAAQPSSTIPKTGVMVSMMTDVAAVLPGLRGTARPCRCREQPLPALEKGPAATRPAGPGLDQRNSPGNRTSPSSWMML